MFSHLSIKLRLSLAMAVGTLTLTILLLAIGKYLYQQKEIEFHDSYLNGLDNLWHAIAETEQSFMASNFTSLTRNRGLSKALYKGDAKAIEDSASPTAGRF